MSWEGQWQPLQPSSAVKNTKWKNTSQHVLKIRLLNALQLQNSLSNEDWSVHEDGHAPVALKCNVSCTVQRLGNDPRNKRKFAGTSEKGGPKRSSVHLSATVTKSWTPANRQVKHGGEGEGGISGACRKMEVQARIGWDCVWRNVIFLPRNVSNLMWQQQKCGS